MSQESKKHIPGGTKDAQGMYVRLPSQGESSALSTSTAPLPETLPSALARVPSEGDLSVDDMMKKGLKAIYGVLRACLAESRKPDPSRESVQNLKDCMMLLRDLKEIEDDLLDTLSDEELKKAAKVDDDL